MGNSLLDGELGFKPKKTMGAMKKMTPATTLVPNQQTPSPPYGSTGSPANSSGTLHGTVSPASPNIYSTKSQFNTSNTSRSDSVNSGLSSLSGTSSVDDLLYFGQTPSAAAPAPMSSSQSSFLSINSNNDIFGDPGAPMPDLADTN